MLSSYPFKFTLFHCMFRECPYLLNYQGLYHHAPPDKIGLEMEAVFKEASSVLPHSTLKSDWNTTVNPLLSPPLK